MAYTELKLELERLLNEDLNNRNSLQELRRNVFLSSENHKKTNELIQQKESEITNLAEKVSHKEQDLESLRAELNTLKTGYEQSISEINSLKEQHQAEINSLLDANQKLRENSSESNSLREQVSAVSLENDHFASKIRELIFHIDEQNSIHEKQLNEIQNLKESIKSLTAEKSQLKFDLSESNVNNDSINTLTLELSNLKEKTALVQGQYNASLELINGLNIELQKSTEAYKELEGEFSFVAEKFFEEKELLVKDNGDLIAEMGLIKLENEDLFTSFKDLQFKNTELQSQIDQFSDSLSELRAKDQVILSLNEKITELNNQVLEFSNQPQIDEQEYLQKIENLDKELTIVSNELNESQSKSKLLVESFEYEKSNLLLKLNDLEARLHQETSSVNKETSANNEQDEVFINKLFKQIDLLNDEKLTLETENEEAKDALKNLENRCTELTQIIESQHVKIESLEETNKQVKLAVEFSDSDSSNKDLKMKINELVREIDKCIALLSV